jgi:uncharacterized protein
LLASAGSAFAVEASFDCKDAALVDEKIICSDPLLGKADESLAQSYSDLMSAADAARQESLRADQHNWLVLRNRECAVSKATKVTDDSRAGYVDCFLAAYEEREIDLANIKAMPQKQPGEVSSPIRKSRFAAGEQPGTESASGIDTKLIMRTGPQPLWSNDGRLIAIAGLAGAAKSSLYAWQPGHDPVVLSAPMDDAGNVESLCVHGDSVVLTRKASAESATVSLKTDAAVGPLAWAARFDGDACGGKPVQDDHFVTLKNGGKEVPVHPLIRKDRRLSQGVMYVPGADRFIVSTASRPDALRTEIERRWAKTDCLPFWQVAASSGEATRGCIPYGPYVKTVPQPLPTKAGLFFAADDQGLYKVTGDTVVRVVSGRISLPALSADQCLISFAEGDGGVRPLKVLDACKK